MSQIVERVLGHLLARRLRLLRLSPEPGAGPDGCGVRGGGVRSGRRRGLAARGMTELLTECEKPENRKILFGKASNEATN